MAPISYQIASKGKIILSFQCKKCGYKGRNKAAHESSLQADDLDKILLLSFVKNNIFKTPTYGEPIVCENRILMIDKSLSLFLK